MTNRLTDAMNKLNVDSARGNAGRSSNAVPASKRHSGLDTSTINAMFPDAAAAIATEKAKFTQQTGNAPSSNRNSMLVDMRSGLGATNTATVADGLDLPGPVPASPWGNNGTDSLSGHAKNNVNQTPMGQFVQPPQSGLRSPGLPHISSNSNIQSTTLTTPDRSATDMPLLSPYNVSGNWASMTNTPLVSSFTPTPAASQADMVANATAMKLAALSTVNNRFALDDVRKYRRARSNDPSAPNQNSVLPGANVVMINEHGQMLSPEQMRAIQVQQQNLSFGQRSRPSSPGIALQQSMASVPFMSPQNPGFLGAYGGSSPSGHPGEAGYLSDHSEMNRGRSPRGRRGSSKPPEDPTNPSLLQDIPSWLRSLRLHKYTENLKHLKWTELIELDDEALEDLGVNALGARRKMLKVFEQVKGKWMLKDCR